MTDTALAVPAELVDIRTGALVPATADKAVELLTAVREMRSRMLGLVKDCEAVLLEESRRQGSKTLHLQGATATITGGSEIAWDVSTLTELLAQGLSADRYAELVAETVSYKVNNSVAKQLEAANPVYAETIGRARKRAEKPFRVSVR